MFTDLYPEKAPVVICETPIYHPNIDFSAEPDTYDETCTSNVCVSLLDDWEPSYGLEDCIQGLLFLFYQPNLEDPLSEWFDSDDYGSFAEGVKLSLEGGTISGYDFPVNNQRKNNSEDNESQQKAETEIQGTDDNHNDIKENKDSKVNCDGDSGANSGNQAKFIDSNVDLTDETSYLTQQIEDVTENKADLLQKKGYLTENSCEEHPSDSGEFESQLPGEKVKEQNEDKIRFNDTNSEDVILENDKGMNAQLDVSSIQNYTDSQLVRNPYLVTINDNPPKDYNDVDQDKCLTMFKLLTAVFHVLCVCRQAFQN